MCVFGFMVLHHNLDYMALKQEGWFWLSSGVTNFKATSGVKITSPPGTKKYIDSSYLNPFSQFLQIHRDTLRLQFLCLNHKRHLHPINKKLPTGTVTWIVPKHKKYLNICQSL
jgi:hypothetical protein